MREFGIGQSVPRVEDRRLLTGRGNFTDDRRVPGAAEMVVLRSPHAAARIRAIDATAARAMPGVIAILTGEDVKADGLGLMSCSVKRRRRDGSPMVEPPFPLLADGRVNTVGAAVAAVIAETKAQAADAAEAIGVDYDPVPAVATTAAAIAGDAPVVWDEVPGNESFLFELGDRARVDEAFAKAAHVVELDYAVTRVSTNTMEVRAAIGFHDPLEDRYTLYAGVQSPHRLRDELAANVLKVPAGRIRVISPDMGGGFGMRGTPFPEHALVLWAARRTGRPVRWTATRSEALASDYHARDNVSHAALALDAEGRFLGLKVQTTAAMGGYLSFTGPHSPTNNLGGLAGVYTTPAIHAEVRGVFTNTSPTATYRGAGRPEASYGLERLIDVAAFDLGIDPVELRRRNMIPASALPWDTGFVFTYDSGDFEGCLDRALAAADRDGFEARRAAAAAEGKLRGMGVASVIEIAGGPLPLPNEESAAVRFDTDGGVSVLMGTHSHGQGHETAFRQIASEALGVPFDSIRVLYGDTDLVHHGKGTFGSRSISVGGAALLRASEKMIERARAIAAHMLEAAEDDVTFADGTFTVAGTDRTIGLVEVAKTSYLPAKMPRGAELGLSETAIVVPPGPTYPNGCHVCEVEIDPDTGVTEIVTYTVFDDVGVALNPMMVEGQVHGGVVQGAGQALFEQVVYEEGSGQLLTGSFMDYVMPRADDFPSFHVHEHNIPSKNNPMGMKGAGEAGTVGALPAVMNAVVDALRPLGVRHLDMPATPERVWQAIRTAGAVPEHEIPHPSGHPGGGYALVARRHTQRQARRPHGRAARRAAKGPQSNAKSGGDISMANAESRNMKLLSQDTLVGFGGMGEGMCMQTAKDGRRIMWLAHESAPKNFTGVDVTDPRKPRVVVQTELPHMRMRSNSLELTGDILAVAYQTQQKGDQPAGVELFDVSTPEEPKSISFFDCSGPHSRGVHQLWFADGEYLHFAAGSEDFVPTNEKDDQFYRCVDVRNPSKPVEVGRWWYPGTREGDNVAPPERHPQFDSGFRAHNTNVYPERPDRLYMGYLDGGTFVMDISDKSNPQVLGHWNPHPPYPGFAHTVLPLFSKDILLVTDESIRDDAMDWPKLCWVVDARKEDNLVPIGTLPMPPLEEHRTRGGRFGAHNLHENRPGPSFHSDDIIFGTFFNGGVRAFDLSNPLEPKEIAYFIPPRPDNSPVATAQINDVYVDENRIIYCVDRHAGGMYALEMTD